MLHSYQLQGLGSCCRRPALSMLQVTLRLWMGTEAPPGLHYPICSRDAHFHIIPPHWMPELPRNHRLSLLDSTQTSPLRIQNQYLLIACIHILYFQKLPIPFHSTYVHFGRVPCGLHVYLCYIFINNIANSLLLPVTSIQLSILPTPSFATPLLPFLGLRTHLSDLSAIF